MNNKAWFSACAGANAGQILRGVTFDGANDSMARGGNLTGNADGKKGIVSFWIKMNGGNAADQTIFHQITLPTEQGCVFSRDSANKISIYVYAVGSYASPAVDLVSTSNITTSSGWVHVLASWDTSIGAAALYINGVLEDTHTPSNVTLDYMQSEHHISASSRKINADFAGFYFNKTSYLDLSVLSNRRKFITSAGKPANLGVNGQLPTGSPPIIFLNLNNGDAVSSFGTNKGTGGDFTITGTLTESPTHPEL